MKTIFITLSEDITARNILFTGFWKEFEVQAPKNLKIIFLVQPGRLQYYKDILEKENVHVESFKRLPPQRLERLIMSLARSGINSKTNLWSKMRSYHRGDSSWIDTMFKRFLASIFGGLDMYKLFLRKLIISCGSDAHVELLFTTYKPDAVFTTSLTNFDFDVLIGREARRKKIKLIGMVRSWDNLSSHGLLRIVPDVFFLQNIFLKEMAVQYQAIDPKNTSITLVGLPHYDVLKDISKVLEPRETFLKNIGIDPTKKVIFYGAMGGFLFIHEAEMPSVFNRLIEEKAIPEDALILYRAHPKFMIDASKMGEYPHVVFDTAGKYVNPESKDVGKNENSHLINALYHSDVIVTTASTIAIDAAIMDKPVICTGFDGTTDKSMVQYWESAGRFYDHYTHFEALMKTKGARFAKSPAELSYEIKAYLADPSRDREGRRKIIDQFAAPFDGKAGSRLAQLVMKEIL
ncbi:MAG: CDP-glycerol glycerophosphotransferase family protein [bacterium]|nr:CDP-glycerol glycerophosphotransferase family protein [bacterium]